MQPLIVCQASYSHCQSGARELSSTIKAYATKKCRFGLNFEPRPASEQGLSLARFGVGRPLGCPLTFTSARAAKRHNPALPLNAAAVVQPTPGMEVDLVLAAYIQFLAGI